jgi:hypothetical protein
LGFVIIGSIQIKLDHSSLGKSLMFFTPSSPGFQIIQFSKPVDLSVSQFSPLKKLIELFDSYSLSMVELLFKL